MLFFNKNNLLIKFLFMIILAVYSYVYINMPLSSEVSKPKNNTKVNKKLAQNLSKNRTPYLKSSFDQFQNYLNSRKEGLIKVKTLEIKNSATIIRGETLYNNYIILQVKHNISEANKSEFLRELKSLMVKWGDLYEHIKNDQSEINVYYSGSMIGTITSNKATVNTPLWVPH